MSNDPLPLPDILAAPPGDAQEACDANDEEYAAIYAEIAATERGRWFLSEYVKRHRGADTQRLVGSLARAEAAVRGDAPAELPAAFARNLADLAAAIGQVEAVIAAGAAPAADGLAASERIQDIAFALREREIDAALCDALETALYELGEAFAHSDAAAERAQSAAALLRGLQASVSTMIALAAASPAAEPARVAEPGEPIWGMTSEVQAGALAADAAAPASLPDEWPPMEPVPPDSATGVPLASEGVEPPSLETRQTPETVSVASREWETHAAPEAEMPAYEIEPPHDERPEDIGSLREPANDPLASEEILPGSSSGEAVSAEESSHAPLRGEEAASEQQPPSEGLSREAAPSSEASGEEPAVAMKVSMPATTEPAEPLQLGAEGADLAAGFPADDENAGTAQQSRDSTAQSADDAVETALSAADDLDSLLEEEPVRPLPQAAQAAGLQEDPDDLFEPLPPEGEAGPSAGAAMHEPPRQIFSPELPAPAFSSAAMQAEPSQGQPSPRPVGAAAPAARAIPRPPPSDPLAAVRALSEEELIALFS
jgi:hypothetical protein